MNNTTTTQMVSQVILGYIVSYRVVQEWMVSMAVVEIVSAWENAMNP